MLPGSAARFKGFCRGMGIGGWLTNDKRFNLLPQAWQMPGTIGDPEHFKTDITSPELLRTIQGSVD